MNDIILNCVTITDGQTCTINGNEPFITPFFNAGDVVISLFLFIIIILMFIQFLKSGINSVKVVREFQGNNSQDGKEFYKI